MASLTIRQLDENIKQKIRLQAAQNGRSMEAEVRAIFSKLFADKSNENKIGIASLIQDIVKKSTLANGDELALPKRNAKTSHRQLDFSDEAYG